MEAIEGKGRGTSPEPAAVEQAFRVGPDGSVYVEWVTPAAGGLVVAVWRAIGHGEVPVAVGNDNLYCG